MAFWTSCQLFLLTDNKSQRQHVQQKCHRAQNGALRSPTSERSCRRTFTNAQVSNKSSLWAIIWYEFKLNFWFRFRHFFFQALTTKSHKPLHQRLQINLRALKQQSEVKRWSLNTYSHLVSALWCILKPDSNFCSSWLCKNVWSWLGITFSRTSDRNGDIWSIFRDKSCFCFALFLFDESLEDRMFKSSWNADWCKRHITQHTSTYSRSMLKSQSFKNRWEGGCPGESMKARINVSPQIKQRILQAM